MDDQNAEKEGKWIPFQMQIRSAGEDGRQADSLWVLLLKSGIGQSEENASKSGEISEAIGQSMMLRPHLAVSHNKLRKHLRRGNERGAVNPPPLSSTFSGSLSDPPPSRFSIIRRNDDDSHFSFQRRIGGSDKPKMEAVFAAAADMVKGIYPGLRE